MKRLLFLSFLAMTLVLPACGGGGGGSDPGDVFNPPPPGEDTGGGNPDTTPATIILSASKTVVKPDNADSSDIVAHVLSAGNVLLPGVTVNFSTDGGALNARTATTDSTGKASVKFTSGATANGTDIIITATAPAGTDVSDDVVVQIADMDIPSDGSSINAFPLSIKSDGVDSSLVTFTVVNTNGAPVANIPVTFATDSGAISVASATTDATGKVTTLFNSGLNKKNRSAKVTATAGNITKEAAIQIVGSTLTLSPNDPTKPTILPIGQKETLTIVAKDAASKTVSGEAITFVAAGTGGVSLSTQGSVTDVNGQTVVDVTGVTMGTVTLTVQGLGVTATKTYEITENAGSGGIFRITNPSTEQSSHSLSVPVTVTVNAPSPTTKVLFASTLGTWGTSNFKVVDVVGGTASAALTSTMAGIATVSASDPSNSSLMDSVSLSFSAAANTAADVALQASATVMATTVSSDAKQEVQLVATVRSDQGQVVGGAPVAFSISNPTGGGEYISPPVAYTNSQGQAYSTFTSGVLTSPAVDIVASLVDFPEVTSTIPITIGGEAGSITLGRATEMTALNQTTYSLPISVLVSDGKGGPVGSVPVSLTVWPVCYVANDGIQYKNEDLDENLSLGATEDLNLDKQLTPPASAAGNIIPSPPIVTAENGIGNFNLIYLKVNAGTYVRLKATATVSGTETSSSMYFDLPIIKGDEEKLPPPPFDPPTTGTNVCPAH